MDGVDLVGQVLLSQRGHCIKGSSHHQSAVGKLEIGAGDIDPVSDEFVPR